MRGIAFFHSSLPTRWRRAAEEVELEVATERLGLVDVLDPNVAIIEGVDEENQEAYQEAEKSVIPFTPTGLGRVRHPVGDNINFEPEILPATFQTNRSTTQKRRFHTSKKSPNGA